MEKHINFEDFPEFKDISSDDLAHILYCSDENLKPLRDILLRKNSNNQLKNSLKVAYNYFSDRHDDKFEEESPLVKYCKELLDLYQGNITDKILRENFEELLPLLKDDDYTEIVDDYSEYTSRE